MPSLQTVFDACQPRADVLSGTTRDEQFVADLARVVNGTAPAEYADAPSAMGTLASCSGRATASATEARSAVASDPGIEALQSQVASHMTPALERVYDGRRWYGRAELEAMAGKYIIGVGFVPNAKRIKTSQ